MTQCYKCGGLMGIEPSTFPGWDLLACRDCGRPIRLISRVLARPSSTPMNSRRDLNRALRAARRRTR